MKKELLNNSVKIANSYGIDITLELVIEYWNESHRHWHIINHLYDMLVGIDDSFHDGKMNEREYNILIIAAIFHDIVYNTKRNDNEEKSVEFMMSLCDPNKINLPSLSNVVSEWIVMKDLKKVSDIIIGTKTHDSKNKLSKIFNDLDTSILDADFVKMLDWEDKIYKEYKWVGWKKYRDGRIDFLSNSIRLHPDNIVNIKKLINHINIK